MPAFGRASREKLETVHPVLRGLLYEAIEHFDFTIIQGHRGKEEQDEYFRTGRSKAQFPNSKHNSMPSMAVDIAPWHAEAPHVRWDRPTEFAALVGFIRGLAAPRGIVLRWGADWDSDGDIHEHAFLDYPHVELVSWPEELAA